jgi:hypothetical protein
MNVKEKKTKVNAIMKNLVIKENLCYCKWIQWPYKQIERKTV